MIRFLFRRLTAERHDGRLLFNFTTKMSREPHWYLEGQLPDTLDGRFAVLATILAIIIVRLESSVARGDVASVALTEQFIDVMESEHREMGLGDPTLGRTVRKLVGILARRTDLWRRARSAESNWMEATRESLYKGDVAPAALLHSANELKRLDDRLFAASISDIEEGRIA